MPLEPQPDFDSSWCGTPRGRGRHRRHGQPMCEPCREAWNEQSRATQAKSRASGWIRPSRRAPKRRCFDCGETLSTGGRAASEPRCTQCYRRYRDTLSAARNRRRRLEAKAAKSAAGTKGSAVWVTGTCAQCLQHFARRGQASPFCSRACNRKARSSKRQFKISMRDRLAIYERDEWTCQLCMEPVDRDLMSLNPMDNWAPSLDHIEPQSWVLIPDHSANNLRLAHRWCNSVRGDLTHYTDADLRAA